MNVCLNLWLFLINAPRSAINFQSNVRANPTLTTLHCFIALTIPPIFSQSFSPFPPTFDLVVLIFFFSPHSSF